MLTNNWYEYFRISFGAADGGYNSSATVYDGSGTSYHPSCNDGLKSYLFPHEAKDVKTTHDYGVIFGDGTVAPAKTDYKLSGNIISTISNTTSEFSHRTSGEKTTFISTFVLRNTGSEPITISEVGWVGSFSVSGTTSSKRFLLDRALLDSPVTIPAGERGMVVYKRSVTIPA